MKPAIIVAVIIALAFMAYGKYSPCNSYGDFWWAWQHVTGNQCWAWQQFGCKRTYVNAKGEDTGECL